MKIKFYQILALLIGLCMQQPAFAVEKNAYSNQPIAAIQPAVADSATVLSPEPMKKNGLQKMLERKIEKKRDRAVKREKAGKTNESKYGRLSILFLLSGILFYLIASPLLAPALIPLSVIMSLIFGILGIKRDKEKVLAILGTAVSGLLVVLATIAGLLFMFIAIAFLFRFSGN